MSSRFSQKAYLALPAILVALLALEPTAAYAYVGPTAGIGLFSAAMGFLVAFVSAIGVILAWPVRILFRKIRGLGQKREVEPAAADPRIDLGS